MIRIVDEATYWSLRQRARRFTWDGLFPKPDSIAGSLIIAVRQIEPGRWSVWLVEPFRETGFRAWLKGAEPSLPSFAYDVGKEESVIWLNAAPQRGLSVSEIHLPGNTWRCDRFRGAEIVAYTSGNEISRAWIMDRTKLSGLEPGIDARTIRVRQQTNSFIPDPVLTTLAAQLHANFLARAGKRMTIEKEGVLWT